jgi:valine dehydrogenase (NAD+)
VARLAERGIVYVPDYAANAGGLIQVGTEYLGGDLSTVHPRVARIEHTCRGILAAAAAAGVTTAEAAARLAERRLRTAAAAA